MKLRSIAEEAAACREAWKARPRTVYGVHIHHERVIERRHYPIEERIAYILEGKPKKERALRLRLMRPITVKQWRTFQRVANEAWRQRNRATNTAWKDYERVGGSKAYATFQRIVKAATLTEGEQVAEAHLALCVPDCPFDGRTIFPPNRA
jgi:hypothetical protein